MFRESLPGVLRLVLNSWVQMIQVSLLISWDYSGMCYHAQLHVLLSESYQMICLVCFSFHKKTFVLYVEIHVESKINHSILLQSRKALLHRRLYILERIQSHFSVTWDSLDCYLILICNIVVCLVILAL